MHCAKVLNDFLISASIRCITTFLKVMSSSYQIENVNTTSGSIRGNGNLAQDNKEDGAHKAAEKIRTMLVI